MGGRLWHIVVCSVMFLAGSRCEICQEDTCVYNFAVRHTRSMTFATEGASYNIELNGTQLQIAENLLRLKETTPLVGNPVSPDDVITLDGVPATIIVINDQFPGPTIEVMEGSEVIIHVTNRLHTEGISIHWHGMYQRGTPWMDGTAYVSQCLIQPHQTFTYRFTATPAGTHWYHSHVAAQRMDGLFGMFIVHKRLPQIPHFTLAVQDWFEFSATDRLAVDPWGPEFQGTGEIQLHDTLREYSIDGVQIGAITNYTGLINGRGRYHPDMLLPLTEITVTKGQRVRFHTANTGGEYAWEISVDRHTMNVVASDGYDIAPTEVDSFIIESGETMDVELLADQAVGNYWIRARTLRATTGWNPNQMDGQNVEVNAILRYTGSDTTTDPDTTPSECIQRTTPCRVFNCNFEFYAEQYNRKGVTYTDVRSGYSQSHLEEEYGIKDDDFVEHFLNFAFTVGSSVNSRRFREPSAPLYQQDASEYVTTCDDAYCDVHGCTCTHVLTLPRDRTVQLVLTNLQPEGEKIFAHHPIHLHGTGFAVMRIGYASQDNVTGHWSTVNPDVQCEPGNKCAHAQWRNGVRPTLNTERPVVKDTLVVPARGYAVIRFRSVNPGYWFVHCHVEQHVTDGMNMVLNIGPGEHPPLPPGFPTCYNYTADSLSVPPTPSTTITTPPSSPVPEKVAQDAIVMSLSQFVGTVVGCVALGGVLASVPVIILICTKKEPYYPSAKM